MKKIDEFRRQKDVNELIELIQKTNEEFGYRIIHFRRKKDEHGKLYWMIWYGYSRVDGSGRMAFWEDTHTATKIVDVIGKMHRFHNLRGEE